MVKFRAKVEENGALTRVLQALSQVNTKCLLNMTPDLWTFHVSQEYSKGALVFSEIMTKSAFSEYLIESPHRNELAVEVVVTNMFRALRSGASSFETSIKLAKKDGRAYLTFEFSENDSIHLVQDVPVTLQSPKKVMLCAEPDVPAPEIKMKLPKLKPLRTVIDRMKTIDDLLTIRLSSDGRASFRVETPMVSIETFFRDLSLNPDEKQSQAEVFESVCKLNVAKFARMLQGCSLLPQCDHMVACIAEQHAFIVHVIFSQDLGTMTFYIPLIADD